MISVIVGKEETSGAGFNDGFWENFDFLENYIGNLLLS